MQLAVPAAQTFTMDQPQSVYTGYYSGIHACVEAEGSESGYSYAVLLQMISQPIASCRVHWVITNTRVQVEGEGLRLEQVVLDVSSEEVRVAHALLQTNVRKH